MSFNEITYIKRLISNFKILKKIEDIIQINDFEMFFDFLDPIDREIILKKNLKNKKNTLIFNIKQIKGIILNYFYRCWS